MQRATTQANGLAGPTTFLGLFLSVPIGDAAPGVPAQGGRYPPPNECVPQQRAPSPDASRPAHDRLRRLPAVSRAGAALIACLTDNGTSSSDADRASRPHVPPSRQTRHLRAAGADLQAACWPVCLGPARSWGGRKGLAASGVFPLFGSR